MNSASNSFLVRTVAGFVDVNDALVQVALPHFDVARRNSVQHLLHDPPQIGCRH